MPKASGFRTYVSAVRDLREAAGQNKSDNAFARQGHVVYILDANVLVHFIRGGSDSTAGSYSFRGLLDDAEAAGVNDRLTTEYLLTNQLPGQRGEPLLMAGRHWNEVLSRATVIARQLGHITEYSTPIDISALREINDPIERFKAAEKQIPKRILEALKTASAVRRRLKIALGGEDSYVRPLDQTTYWPAGLDRIRDEDYGEWRKAILTSLKRAVPATKPAPNDRTTSAKSKSRRGSNNVAADAIVLASIQSLYREHPEACNDRRKLLFLLVTADHGVLEAVRTRQSDLDKEGIPNFVRHPRVFSPILNFSSMLRARREPTALDAEVRKVFSSVETSLDLLLTPQRRAGVSLDILRLMDDWAAAARRLAALNVGFFGNDSEDLRTVAEMLIEEDGLRTATVALRETISEIGSEHSRLLAIGALRDLAFRVRAAAARRGRQSAPRSAILIVGVDILSSVVDVLPKEGPFAGRSISGLKELLDYIEFTKGGDFIDRIGAALQDRWDQPVSQLLAACIYLAVNAHQAGRECALRAVDLARNKQPKSSLRREAEYCAALATRLSLRTRDEFLHANRALLLNIAERSRGGKRADSISRLRDDSERAALVQAACMRQRLELDPEHAEDIFEPQELVQEFDEALELINRTLQELENFETTDDDPLSYVIRRLKLQLCVNRVGGLNDRCIFGKDTSHVQFESNELRSALEELNDAISEIPSITISTVMEINCVVSRVILDGSSRLDEALATVESALEVEWLTELDRREYQFLRAKLPTLANLAKKTAPVVFSNSARVEVS